MPKTRGHNSSREQFWRDTITAWKASGQSVRAFCAARGLSEPTFYARRRELADRVPPTSPDTPSQTERRGRCRAGVGLARSMNLTGRRCLPCYAPVVLGEEGARPLLAVEGGAGD